MTDHPVTPAAEPPVSTARVLTTLMVPLFMALLALSVINVALPVIGPALDAGSTGLQWVVSGYALSFGLLLVPSGRLGDATGRKRIFLAGVAVFTAGAVIAGFAQNIEMLNAARVVQGIGSGMLNPQTFGLIQKYFRGAARARAFATMATTVSVATASGPLVGGLLIEALGDDLGWRAMFFVNVPLGVIALVLGQKWLPDDRALPRTDRDGRDVGGSRARAGALGYQEDDGDVVAAPPTRPRRLDVDPVGIVLLGAAVLSVMLPFLNRGANPAMWALVPLGVALLGAFAWWERRYELIGRPPLVNPEIFRDPAFRNGMIIVSIYFMGGTSLWIVMPMYLQFHLGYAPIDSAFVSLPASICAAVSAQVAGRFVLTLGRRLVIGGFCLTLTALGTFILLAGLVESGAVGYLIFMAPAALMGTAQGMTISPNQTLTVRAVDPAYGGVAGSIISLGQRMGTAIGTAVVPGVLFWIVESQDDWLLAFRAALGLIAVLAAGALAFSVVDRRREKRCA
ncbi:MULTISPECIES: MFS transporter [unclassified Dietzia]|uniref:MFS transporter n=1 Tax=unclassified Dietzia TaxID=2617939 RepID=UPI000D229A8F|nr:MULTISPECIES: MFS transporter [unclassified Dietzia]AVZ38489.1 arabinose ABC transporter permease [Dietzia sp. JS16-p6b]